jgi:hypothetical protein
MLKTKEITTFLRPHYTNLILIIPASTVLLPAAARIPLHVPLLLIAPHWIYLILFSTAIILALPKSLRYVFSLLRKHALDLTQGPQPASAYPSNP